jgi:hypothetical protein
VLDLAIARKPNCDEFVPKKSGSLFCSRAETEHLAGIPNAAEAGRAEADVIAAEPDSELSLALARVHDLLCNGRNSKVDSAIRVTGDAPSPRRLMSFSGCFREIRPSALSRTEPVA